MNNLKELIEADDADALRRAIRRREISGYDTPVFGAQDFPPVLLYAVHVGAVRVFSAMLETKGPLELVDNARRGLHDYLRTSSKFDAMVDALVCSGHPGLGDFLVRSPENFVQMLSGDLIQKISDRTKLVISKKTDT